jgi:hypothetical protein
VPLERRATVLETPYNVAGDPAMLRQGVIPGRAEREPGFSGFPDVQLHI